MAVQDRARRDLLAKLDEVLGPERVQTVMELMSEQEAAQSAMREDLLAVGQRMDRRFERADVRFNAMDARFDAMDARFDVMDARFDVMDARFDVMDARFDVMDARFDALTEKLDYRFEASENKMLAAFRAEMNAQTRMLIFGLLGAFTANSGVVFAALRFG